MAAIVGPLLVKREASIGPTMGALYVGGMLIGILYGSTNVQTFLYYKNFPRDQTFQKCAVALLWILDTLHMIFTIIEFWHYLIDSFGDYETLVVLHWSFSWQIAVSVVIILIVQSLYTRRIWMLTSNRYQRIWTWILIVVLMASYAAGFLFLVDFVSTLIQLSHLRGSIIFGLAISSLDDVLLATAICHLLSLRQTAFEETRSKIWAIMSYAVVSGALTSICSLTSVICLAIMPHNMIFQGIEFLVPKLYVNSYLAMLNVRKSMRDYRMSYNYSSGNMIQFSELSSGPLASRDSQSGFQRPMVESKYPSASARISRPVEVRVDVVHGIEQCSIVECGDTDLTSPSRAVYRARDYQINERGYAV